MTKLMQGQVLQILLVSSQSQLRDQVRNALEGGRFQNYRVHWVSDAQLAVSRARDLLPHVILVDDDLDIADPIPLIRKLASSVSSATILFLVDQERTSEASQAVLMGARSFIVKPMLGDELMTTLLQVLAWERVTPVEAESVQGESGHTVIFCAPKGGTGRTTLAINTAVSLHKQQEEPVVIVDADFAAPALDVALNLPPERTVVDLLPRLSRLDEMLVDSVLTEHASGIKVLLAPPPADLTNPLSLPQVQHILVMLKRMFSWVVVDLGLPLDETAFAFLDVADKIVMTVLPEMVGLRNTRLMLDHILEEGYPEDKVSLILNRTGLKGGVDVQNIEERLNVPVRFTVPDDQSLVTHSVNRGVPLTVSHPRSAVARSIRKIARTLESDVSSVGAMKATTESDKDEKPGLLARLWSRRDLGPMSKRRAD